MDEFHYYSDRDRGTAWQVPLLTMPQTRFLLMSATLGETAFFEEALTKLNGLPTSTVRSTDRPVPLKHEYSELPLAKTLESLTAEGQSPVYVIHFTQLDAAQSAQDFTSINVCSREEKAAIAQRPGGFQVQQPLRAGHQKMVATWDRFASRRVVAQVSRPRRTARAKGIAQGYLRHRHTGVGINVPIRTVLFSGSANSMDRRPGS